MQGGALWTHDGTDVKLSLLCGNVLVMVVIGGIAATPRNRSMDYPFEIG